MICVKCGRTLKKRDKLKLVLTEPINYNGQMDRTIKLPPVTRLNYEIYHEGCYYAMQWAAVAYHTAKARERLLK